jgi:hypothetical protein
MTLKVIGAGFGRTGTLSLKAALEQLGFGRCYHMMEVIPNPKAPDLWSAAADGKPDWETIFQGYQSAVDWPACHFWRELSDFYRDAKIILTVRDAEKWFASTQATIFHPDIMGGAKPPLNFQEMAKKTVFADIGGDPNDHGACIAAYNRHNAKVIETAPADRLLVYEVSQGWGPLCAFLGVPVPDQSFPNSNASDNFAFTEVLKELGARE